MSYELELESEIRRREQKKAIDTVRDMSDEELYSEYRKYKAEIQEKPIKDRLEKTERISELIDNSTMRNSREIHNLQQEIKSINHRLSDTWDYTAVRACAYIGFAFGCVVLCIAVLW